jgi:acyl CoA:acetate/3-ketoacid CoA transferase
MPSPLQFAYFQGGGFDRTCLSFMQVAADGSVNASKLALKPHVTAGAGGFVDITAAAKRIVFAGYLTAGGLQLDLSDGALTVAAEGRNKKFVPDVEHVTFSGPKAVERGAEVVYVTERAVFRLIPDGLEVTEVAPGIVFHYTPDAEVTAVEMDSMASKLVDLSRLEVEGLPVSVTREERRESKAG